jgi:hypothetical protein
MGDTNTKIDSLHKNAFLTHLRPLDRAHADTVRQSIYREKKANGATAKNLEWEGRSYGFTNGFMGTMFRDETLHTTSLK